MVKNPAFTLYFHRVPNIFQFTIVQLWAFYPSFRVDEIDLDTDLRYFLLEILS